VCHKSKGYRGATLGAPVMRSLELCLPRHLRVDAADRRPVGGFPALQRILSRARVTPVAARDRDAVLLEAFGVKRQRDWPVAPFSWLADGGEAGGAFWLRADPVHLRADRDVLVLSEVDAADLTAGSAETLVDALNAYFQPDALRFFAAAPARWYVELPAAPDMRTSPTHAVAARNVDPFLPQGPDALAWHRRFNEIQMLFHSHPVNEAREAAGQPTVNSVWFWGGGILPDRVRGRFARVWSDDPLARGLARAARIDQAAAPAGAEEWLSAAGDGTHLVVLDHPGSRQDDALATFERAWFAPLLQAVKNRRLSALGILAERSDDMLRFDLAAGDLWKFWRRAAAAA
jgi:hypothetical protein